MPAIVKNKDAEACLRESLEAQGYKLNVPRARGETGVDILATKDDEEWHIEVIGYKSSGPARAKDFYEAFFRVVSRLNDGATHCVIALPIQARVGLPARARQHRVAWTRISKAFSELEIWLVDVENRDINAHLGKNGFADTFDAKRHYRDGLSTTDTANSG